MRWFFLFTICVWILSACDRNNVTEALGTLERERIILKATANEIIVAQPVAEGTQVKKGTLIVQLDDRKQQAKVAHAQAEVAKAAAFLEELRSGAREEDVDAARARVSGARAALTIAEKNYQRARQLLQQKLISQDLPATEWAERLRTALGDFDRQPWIVQEFRESRLIEHPVFRDDGSVETMRGRVRLCPYYFTDATGTTTLGGCLATLAPADKKKIHGMKDAVLLPCVIE